MYVVCTLHNTGQGKMVAAVLATFSKQRAVEVARQIESLGYKFGDDDGVTISFVKTGEVRSKENQAIVYMRMLTTLDEHGTPGAAHRWREGWYDAGFAKEFKEKLRPYWEDRAVAT